MKETKQLTDLERVQNLRESLLEIKKINQELKDQERMRIPTQTGHQSDLKSDSVPIQSGQCSD
jgi:hypothetical protein